MSRSVLVARNVLATLATQVISWGITFLVTLQLPRYLHPNGYGALTLAASFAGIFSLGMSLGTSTVLTRDIARDPSRTGELTLAALALRLPLGLLTLPLCWGVTLALGYSLPQRMLMLIAVAAILAGMLSEVLGAALSGLQEIPRRNLASLADKVVMSGLTLYAISRHAPLLVFAGVGGVSACVGFVINATAFRPYLGALRLPSYNTILHLVRQGLPFLTMAIFISVYGNCDALLLSKLCSVDEIGWYGLAKRLSGITMFLPVALTGAMLPALSRVFHESTAAFESAVGRMFNFVVICAVPFAAILILAPDRIIDLVTRDPAFAPAVPVLMILGAAIILWFLSQAAATALIASDRQGMLSRITGVSALACIPICGTLIFLTQRLMHNGAIGAVTGDALIEMYMVGAYLRALPGGFACGYILSILGRSAAAALPLVILFYFVHDRAGLLLLVPGLLLYILLCWLLRCLHPSDVQMVQQMWKGRVGVS